MTVYSSFYLPEAFISLHLFIFQTRQIKHSSKKLKFKEYLLKESNSPLTYSRHKYTSKHFVLPQMCSFHSTTATFSWE